MTRGNQRDNDRARAAARMEKNSKKDDVAHSTKVASSMNQADIMREKQRVAELKKEGKWPEE